MFIQYIQTQGAHSQATNNNISQILQAFHTELPPRARDEMQEDMQSTAHRQLQFVIQSLHNRTLKHSQKDRRRKLHPSETAI